MAYRRKIYDLGVGKEAEERWKSIQQGDVFFIHSTSGRTSYFSNARSGIIGLGVISANFSVKENHLWIREIKDRINIWPLLIPFSELYLFSELPPLGSWDAPNLNNEASVRDLIDHLLKNYIPLSQLSGFPRMGSFSGVKVDMAMQILNDKRPLYPYSGEIVERISTSKPTMLETVKNVSETMRYADTLKIFYNIKSRTIDKTAGSFTKDNELLARAEEAHTTVLQGLIDIFRKKGYDTRSNRFVDLFAFDDQKSFLFEVKSTENRNFRAQARKGVIQLYENDYFDVRRFVTENKLHFEQKHKILVPSNKPQDNNYIDFINDLKIGVALVAPNTLKAVGADFGFTNI